MGGLEFPEKRALADKLFAIVDEHTAAENREEEEFEQSRVAEESYENGVDDGYKECIQIIQDLIVNALPGTRGSVIDGLVQARDEIARQGAIDLEEAA